MKTSLPAFAALLALLAPVAYAGPTITGGGNANEPPTTPYLIESALSEAREHSLPHFFGALETDYVQAKLFFARHSEMVPDREMTELLSIGAKLFESKDGRDLFQLLAKNNILWDVRKDKPCLDSQGQEMDGSATLPNTVCISIARLSDGPNKLNKSDYIRRTFALAAHETSHLLGTDEAEAEWVQAKANTAGLDSTESGRRFKYWQLVDDMNGNIDAMISLVQSEPDFSKVCVALKAIASRFPMADDLFTHWAPARAEAKLRLNAVSVSAGLILPAFSCSKEGSAAVKQVFAGQSEIPLHQLLKALYRNSIGPVEPIVADDELVTYVEYGDLQALRTELLRIKVRLEQNAGIGPL